LENIKNIHCFGTSHTAGGGFEFDSPQKYTELLNGIYESTGENLTRYNFSWPGQLEKLLPKNIKVLNHAKSGFGNERMYRVAEEIISANNFNKNENLFIFESSYIGRKEYFLNSIDDYVVFNYTFKKGDNSNMTGVGYNYWYDSEEIQQKLDEFKKIVLPFFEQTFKEEEVINKIIRNARFFVSFLKQKKVNFLFLNSLLRNDEIEDKHKVTFKVENKTYADLGELIHSYKYTIENETSGKIQDFHLGYFGNKLTAMNIFNKLIKEEYIDEPQIDVNEKKYHKIFRII